MSNYHRTGYGHSHERAMTVGTADEAYYSGREPPSEIYVMDEDGEDRIMPLSSAKTPSRSNLANKMSDISEREPYHRQQQHQYYRHQQQQQHQHLQSQQQLYQTPKRGSASRPKKFTFDGYSTVSSVPHDESRDATPSLLRQSSSLSKRGSRMVTSSPPRDLLSSDSRSLRKSRSRDSGVNECASMHSKLSDGRRSTEGSTGRDKERSRSITKDATQSVRVPVKSKPSSESRSSKRPSERQSRDERPNDERSRHRSRSHSRERRSDSIPDVSQLCGYDTTNTPKHGSSGTRGERLVSILKRTHSGLSSRSRERTCFNNDGNTPQNAPRWCVDACTAQRADDACSILDPQDATYISLKRSASMEESGRRRSSSREKSVSSSREKVSSSSREKAISSSREKSSSATKEKTRSASREKGSSASREKSNTASAAASPTKKSINLLRRSKSFEESSQDPLPVVQGVDVRRQTPTSRSRSRERSISKQIERSLSRHREQVAIKQRDRSSSKHRSRSSSRQRERSSSRHKEPTIRPSRSRSQPHADASKRQSAKRHLHEESSVISSSSSSHPEVIQLVGNVQGAHGFWVMKREKDAEPTPRKAKQPVRAPSIPSPRSFASETGSLTEERMMQLVRSEMQRELSKLTKTNEGTENKQIKLTSKETTVDVPIQSSQVEHESSRFSDNDNCLSQKASPINEAIEVCDANTIASKKSTEQADKLSDKRGTKIIVQPPSLYHASRSKSPKTVPYLSKSKSATVSFGSASDLTIKQSNSFIRMDHSKDSTSKSGREKLDPPEMDSHIEVVSKTDLKHEPELPSVAPTDSSSEYASVEMGGSLTPSDHKGANYTNLAFPKDKQGDADQNDLSLSMASSKVYTNGKLVSTHGAQAAKIVVEQHQNVQLRDHLLSLRKAAIERENVSVSYASPAKQSESGSNLAIVSDEHDVQTVASLSSPSIAIEALNTSSTKDETAAINASINIRCTDRYDIRSPGGASSVCSNSVRQRQDPPEKGMASSPRATSQCEDPPTSEIYESWIPMTPSILHAGSRLSHDLKQDPPEIHSCDSDYRDNSPTAFRSQTFQDDREKSGCSQSNHGDSSGSSTMRGVDPDEHLKLSRSLSSKSCQSVTSILKNTLNQESPTSTETDTLDNVDRYHIKDESTDHESSSGLIQQISRSGSLSRHGSYKYISSDKSSEDVAVDDKVVNIDNDKVSSVEDGSAASVLSPKDRVMVQVTSSDIEVVATIKDKSPQTISDPLSPQSISNPMSPQDAAAATPGANGEESFALFCDISTSMTDNASPRKDSLSLIAKAQASPKLEPMAETKEEADATNDENPLNTVKSEDAHSCRSNVVEEKVQPLQVDPIVSNDGMKTQSGTSPSASNNAVSVETQATQIINDLVNPIENAQHLSSKTPRSPTSDVHNSNIEATNQVVGNDNKTINCVANVKPIVEDDIKSTVVDEAKVTAEDTSKSFSMNSPTIRSKSDLAISTKYSAGDMAQLDTIEENQEADLHQYSLGTFSRESVTFAKKSIDVSGMNRISLDDRDCEHRTSVSIDEADQNEYVPIRRRKRLLYGLGPRRPTTTNLDTHYVEGVTSDMTLSPHSKDANDDTKECGEIAADNKHTPNPYFVNTSEARNEEREGETPSPIIEVVDAPAKASITEERELPEFLPAREIPKSPGIQPFVRTAIPDTKCYDPERGIDSFSHDALSQKITQKAVVPHQLPPAVKRKKYTDLANFRLARSRSTSAHASEASVKQSKTGLTSNPSVDTSKHRGDASVDMTDDKGSPTYDYSTMRAAFSSYDDQSHQKVAANTSFRFFHKVIASEDEEDLLSVVDKVQSNDEIDGTLKIQTTGLSCRPVPTDEAESPIGCVVETSKISDEARDSSAQIEEFDYSGYIRQGVDAVISVADKNHLSLYTNNSTMGKALLDRDLTWSTSRNIDMSSPGSRSVKSPMDVQTSVADYSGVTVKSPGGGYGIDADSSFTYGPIPLKSGSISEKSAGKSRILPELDVHVFADDTLPSPIKSRIKNLTPPAKNTIGRTAAQRLVTSLNRSQDEFDNESTDGCCTYGFCGQIPTAAMRQSTSLMNSARHRLEP